MFESLLENLGLAKNEAKIYEALLREGESSVGAIAAKSKVHRRNVYDTLNRLVEKGLVFEIVLSKENRYQAVDPSKLSELLQEKQTALSGALSEMQKVFLETPNPEAVFIYRGLEGWKNYIRDILRIGEDDYIMGGKGVWADQKIKSFVNQFSESAHKKGMKFHVLYEEEARERIKPMVEMLGNQYRFIPKEFYSPSAFEVFGDHIVFLSDITEGVLREDLSITVVINQKLADSFRAWFKFMWSVSKK